MIWGLEAKAIILGVVGLAFAGLLYAVHHYKQSAAVWEEKYNGFLAETKALGNVAAAQAKQKEAEQKLAVNTLETQHATDVSTINSNWALELNRVRATAPSRTGGSTVPKPAIAAAVCRDDADNTRLSLALENARLGIRSAVAQYRIGIIGLLTEADGRHATLREAVGILLSERGLFVPKEQVQ